MMVFTIPTIVIEVIMVMEVSLVFSVEPVMIVIIVYLIVIVTMPRPIIIVGISRISLFVDADSDMYLCAG